MMTQDLRIMAGSAKQRSSDKKWYLKQLHSAPDRKAILIKGMVKRTMKYKELTDRGLCAYCWGKGRRRQDDEAKKLKRLLNLPSTYAKGRTALSSVIANLTTTIAHNMTGANGKSLMSLRSAISPPALNSPNEDEIANGELRDAEDHDADKSGMLWTEAGFLVSIYKYSQIVLGSGLQRRPTDSEQVIGATMPDSALRVRSHFIGHLQGMPKRGHDGVPALDPAATKKPSHRSPGGVCGEDAMRVIEMLDSAAGRGRATVVRTEGLDDDDDGDEMSGAALPSIKNSRHPAP
ncbi:hypothetical protein FHL15_004760 [Xylaria flabelliformis]|uniref:Uncharacterized protein n=1 Tax=Xylaria flabelliformis TaxID=2512241 RepID=A0A553I266_9PEZI|nr:hypothetical protein FHL15_004760 [Xylaria flabelliformis]